MKSTQESLASYEKALEMTEPLATARPPNVLALYVVADAYSGLGDIASGRATRAGAAAQEALYWKEASSWYEKSLRISREIPNHGVVSPEGFAAVSPDDVRRRLDTCRQQLNRANLR